MVDFSLLKEGASVKVTYVKKEFNRNSNNKYITELKEYEVRGLVYLVDQKNKVLCLIMDQFIKENGHIRKNNIEVIELASIKSIGGTRFKKEISDILHTELDLKKEADKLKKQKEEIISKLAENTEKEGRLLDDLLKALTVTNTNGAINYDAWCKKVANDIRGVINNVSYDMCRVFEGSIVDCIIADVKPGRGVIKFNLHFTLTKTARIHSKEYEDRLLNDEHVTPEDMKRYLPNGARFYSLLESVFNEVKKAERCTEQEKGYVDFIRYANVSCSVKPGAYETWLTGFTKFIDKNFPKKEDGLGLKGW